MEIIISPKAKTDLLYWKEKGDQKIQEKISALLQAIKDDPFRGIGKPEPLKFRLSGLWSRRINKEHRIIYQVENDVCYIISMRFHYDPHS